MTSNKDKESVRSIWHKSKPYLQALLILIAIVYFAQKLSQGWDENLAILSHFDGALFLLALLILALAFPLLTVASKLSAELFQVNLSMRLSFQSYFYSQAGKYLPGGIWAYVGRVYLFNKQGINKKTAFSMTLMEVLFLCVSGLFCFLMSAYFWQQRPDFILRLSIIAFIAFTLCTLFPFFSPFSSKLLSRFGFQFNLTFQPKKLALILLIYICFWQLVGLGFYVLMSALTQVSTNMIFILAGIYPLAWIMGKLVFFMPAGIGVREGALLYLLVFFLNANQALWVSVVSRLWWIVAEALCVGLVFGWSLLSERKT